MEGKKTFHQLPGCRYRVSEGRQEVRPKARKLAHRRAVAEIVAGSRWRAFEGKTWYTAKAGTDKLAPTTFAGRVLGFATRQEVNCRLRPIRTTSLSTWFT